MYCVLNLKSYKDYVYSILPRVTEPQTVEIDGFVSFRIHIFCLPFVGNKEEDKTMFSSMGIIWINFLFHHHYVYLAGRTQTLR